jgi:23S rRNA pseudouridine2605 synthase
MLFTPAFEKRAQFFSIFAGILIKYSPAIRMRNKGTTGRSGGRRNNASIRKNDLNKGKPGFNRTPVGENKNRPKKGERSGPSEKREDSYSKERGPRPSSSERPEKRSFGPRSEAPRGQRPQGVAGARPTNPRGPKPGERRDESKGQGRYSRDKNESRERPYTGRDNRSSASSDKKEGSYFKERKNYKKPETNFNSGSAGEGRYKQRPEATEEGAERGPEQEGQDGAVKPEVRRKYNNERNDKGRYSRHKEFDEKAKVERAMRPKPAPLKEDVEEEAEIERPKPDRKPFVKGEFSKSKRAEAKDDSKRNFSEDREDGKSFRPRTNKTSFKSQKEDKRMRLNKFISNAGICSRREADEMIAAGVVSVNGKVITELGYKAYPTDEIRYNGEVIKTERQVYVLLNKPKDFITTTDDPEERRTVMALVENACRERIYPVGRLDRGTTGLLLFTNDGDLTKKLTHPSGRVKKIYHVELDKTLKAADMKRIAEGLDLEDGLTVVDAISYVGDDKKQIGVELHSGKNRIVRRIFESLEYKVVKLDRVYFAGLTKKDLTRGKWRFLSDMELNMLRML